MSSKEKTDSEQLKFATAFSVLVLSGIVMGFSPVFVREAEVGAFASAFWRVFFALPFLFAWAYSENSKAVKSAFQFNGIAIIAGLMFSGDLIFWHLSILHTTMANATFTVCLSVVWVAVFSNWFLGEKISSNAMLGLLICLVGLAMLLQSSFSIDPDRLIGDIYGIITSVFLGLYMLAMRAGRRSSKSGGLFLTSTLVTCIVLLVVSLASGEAMLPETSNGWLSLISLGVFTHVGGQGLVTIALGSLSAMFSSLVVFIEALAAAFFGWIWFGEKMSIIQLSGGLLIFAGVWLARPSKS